MLTRLLFTVCTCILALTFSRLGTAQASAGVEAISIGAEPSDLTQNFRFLADPSGKLGVAEILAKGLDQFSPGTLTPLHPGYTSHHYWLDMTVRNLGDNTEWFIIPDYPLLEFEAYEIGDDGSFAATETESFETRFPVRKLQVGKGETKRLLLRVWSPLVVNLQFEMLDAAQLKSRISTENIVMGIITGIFVAMILYNLFLFLNLRDRDYLYYLAFAIANTHINLLSADYPEGIFTWFGLSWWEFIDVYRPLAPLTTLLFARSFLQTKIQHPKLDRIIVLYMGGLGLFMIASFFVPRHLLFPIEDSYFLIAIGLLITAGIQSLRQGFRPSHFYLIGLVLFTLGMAIYITKSEGLLPTNVFTLNAHLFAQALEMLLMSLALSGKIKQLEASKTQAEVTARVKGRLLRVISHDIANPLSIVKGMAYVLRTEKVDSSRVDAISRAVSVIEEIMQFVHKTESLDGVTKLASQNVSLAESFDGLQFVFHKLAADKNIRLNFHLDTPNLFVKAEKTSLTYEVLGNFVGNAIKFSHRGGEVNVRAKSIGHHVQVSIEDNGIGMSERVVASVFDPLINVSRRGTAGEKGGGYGLLLAKAYLEQFGASVVIESVSQDTNPHLAGTKVLIKLLGVEVKENTRSLRQRWRLIP